MPSMDVFVEHKTVEQAVEAFGGNVAIGKILGVGSSAVSNYKTWGRFPEYLHMRVWLAAKERGIQIAPELVGMQDTAQ